MSVTRAIRVIAASLQLYAALSKPRSRTGKKRGKEIEWKKEETDD